MSTRRVFWPVDSSFSHAFLFPLRSWILCLYDYSLIYLVSIARVDLQQVMGLQHFDRWHGPSPLQKNQTEEGTLICKKNILKVISIARVTIIITIFCFYCATSLNFQENFKSPIDELIHICIGAETIAYLTTLLWQDALECTRVIKHLARTNWVQIPVGNKTTIKSLKNPLSIFWLNWEL